MDDLSDRDQKEFNNPTSQAEMIRLAQIMGHVLKIVYKIPKKNERQDLFANVRTTLIRLREWNNSLPESLRLNTATSPAFSSRAVASMHLRYNESIIMATRPVLFHYLKTTLRRPPDASSPISKSVANISSELGEACISAARANNTLLIELYVHGSLATYGLYDAIYVFSSTVILFLSNTLHRNRDNEDRIQTGWNLLQSMNDEGSIPAAEYLQRLSHLKKDFENAWEQGITPAKEETSVLTSTSFAVDERQNIGSSDDYESKPLHKHDGVDNIESLLIEQFDFSFLLEEVENATKADLNPWTGIEINWSPNEYRLF
jgi:hypothetical protein